MAQVAAQSTLAQALRIHCITWWWSEPARTGELPIMQVVLVWNAEGDTAAAPPPRLQQLAGELWRRHGPGSGAAPLVHSVWANFQPSRKNTILGPDWRLLRGDQKLTFQV